MEKYLKDKRIKNWVIIKIEDLPDDFPCLAVQEFPNKSFAEFHLAEYCIVPSNALDKILNMSAAEEKLKSENK